MEILNKITNPRQLFSREDFVNGSSNVGNDPGIYAFYFKSIPPRVPTDNCVIFDNKTLLYVGISPRNEKSQQRLGKRLGKHFKRNASTSTLRMSLGCLLAYQLDIQLDVKSYNPEKNNYKFWFDEGEKDITHWMGENAFFTYQIHKSPWDIESSILMEISLPLNIKKNKHHKFCLPLKALRDQSKENAKDRYHSS